MAWISYDIISDYNTPSLTFLREKSRHPTSLTWIFPLTRECDHPLRKNIKRIKSLQIKR